MRISAWHFSPAPPILYAVRAIVYHKSRVLSRVLRDFSGSEAPGTPAPEPEAALAIPAAVENATEACPARHWLALPLWCSQGAEPQRHWLALPLWRPAGGLLCLPPVAPCLYLLFCPLSPARARRALFPGGDGGALRLFYARGFAPCIPGAEPGRHWKRGRTTRPAGACPGWLPADLATVVPGGGLAFLAACRPCRSGTRRGACLSPRLPTLPLVYFPAPYPPAPFPGGEGGDQGFFMQGASPLASPGLNPGGIGSPCQSGTRRGCAFGISNPAQNRKNRLSMGSAGSQGEGGPGEMELSVASDGGV